MQKIFLVLAMVFSVAFGFNLLVMNAHAATYNECLAAVSRTKTLNINNAGSAYTTALNEARVARDAGLSEARNIKVKAERDASVKEVNAIYARTASSSVAEKKVAIAAANAIYKTSLSACSATRYECIKIYVSVREDALYALLNGPEGYFARILRLHEVKKEGIKKAWLIPDQKARNAEIKNVNMAFTDNSKTAWTALGTARKSVKETYKKNVLTCTSASDAAKEAEPVSNVTN